MVHATLKFIIIDIDGDETRNKNAKPNIPEGELECIEVLKLNFKTLLSDLNELGSKGYHIQGQLYSYALGLANSQ